MVLAVAVGVILVCIGRLAYHRVRFSLKERGVLRSSDQDHLGAFLLTVGVAIAIWFALDSFLHWQTPFFWRLAAVITGFLLADGLSGKR